jgi:hypothetical protein
VTVPDLKPNSQDTSAFPLNNIQQILAEVSRVYDDEEEAIESRTEDEVAGRVSGCGWR